MSKCACTLLSCEHCTAIALDVTRQESIDNCVDETVERLKIEKIEWQEALPVRHLVLWPSKPASFCKIEGDETASHYGAYVADELVCVASIYIDGGSARLRKFATLSECQGKGIGSRVITHILEELQTVGVEHFWCDARTSAVGFYQRFGLSQQGEEFLKSGVPYFKMSLNLSKT